MEASCFNFESGGRARTRFYADGAWLQFGHRLQQLIAPHARVHQTRPAGGIDTVQGKCVLGEIDAEKDNGGHGHLLASTGSVLESRNPMVDLGRSRCMRENLRHRGGGPGDGPFIRWALGGEDE